MLQCTIVLCIEVKMLQCIDVVMYNDVFKLLLLYTTLFRIYNVSFIITLKTFGLS